MDVFAGDCCFDSFDSLLRNAIDTALNLVRSHFPASPLVTLKTDEQSPIHAKRECEIPTGTFKLRGGLVYFDWLRRTHPDIQIGRQR